eukprot:1141535-Pelagomonas_calceolata.AAC.4
MHLAVPKENAHSCDPPTCQQCMWLLPTAMLLAMALPHCQQHTSSCRHPLNTSERVIGKGGSSSHDGFKAMHLALTPVWHPGLKGWRSAECTGPVRWECLPEPDRAIPGVAKPPPHPPIK